jgi:hypothetical protein
MEEGEEGIPGLLLQYTSAISDHIRSVWGLHAVVPGAGGDDAGGCVVAPGDSGTDGGFQVLLALLVTLEPDGVQLGTIFL